jgi:hypothetical protein
MSGGKGPPQIPRRYSCAKTKRDYYARYPPGEDALDVNLCEPPPDADLSERLSKNQKVMLEKRQVSESDAARKGRLNVRLAELEKRKEKELAEMKRKEKELAEKKRKEDELAEKILKEQKRKDDELAEKILKEQKRKEDELAEEKAKLAEEFAQFRDAFSFEHAMNEAKNLKNGK